MEEIGEPVHKTTLLESVNLQQRRQKCKMEQTASSINISEKTSYLQKNPTRPFSYIQNKLKMDKDLKP